MEPAATLGARIVKLVGGGEQKRRPPRNSKPTMFLGVAMVAALLLAGCSSPPPSAGGNNTGGNTTTGGGTTTHPAATHLLMNTSMGDIRILLHTDTAPVTAGNFLALAQKGYFDGQRFHRVIGPAKNPPEGFMDQAGDPLSKDVNQKARWGTGGPSCDLAPQYPCSNGQYTIPDEFACKDGTASSTWTGARGDPCKDHQGLLYKFDHAGLMAMANTGRAHSGASQFFLTMASATFLDGGYPVFGEVEGGIEVVKAIGAVPTDSSDRPITDVFIHQVTVVG